MGKTEKDRHSRNRITEMHSMGGKWGGEVFPGKGREDPASKLPLLGEMKKDRVRDELVDASGKRRGKGKGGGGEREMICIEPLSIFKGTDNRLSLSAKKGEDGDDWKKIRESRKEELLFPNTL